MATIACTDWKTRPYLGSWESWTSDFNSADSDGYCYRSSDSGTVYAFCFSFKTPTIEYFHKSSKIDFTITIVRTSSSFAKSGTLYFKLLTSDPTGSYKNSEGKTIALRGEMKPSASNCDASCDWSSSDQQTHKVTFSISTTNLKANTTYYITVGGSKLIGIGYKGCTPANGYWSATLTYDTYTKVTANTPVITDNKNNTFTISATAGNDGTNNKVNSTTLYYRIGAGGSYTKASFLKLSNLNITCDSFAASQTIYAYTLVDGEYNDAQSTTATAAIKNYQAPTWPSNAKVVLDPSSFKNNRLTVKQLWGWDWSSAKANATNTSSPVKGYRVRFYVNGTNKPIVSYDDKDKTLSEELSDIGLVYDRTHTNYPMYMNATYQGVVPGNEIKLSVQAYTIDGTGTKLLSSEKLSDTYTVQNAGVVNVRVAGEWKEGQVFVRVAGEWKEAETVNVKTASGWQESQ